MRVVTPQLKIQRDIKEIQNIHFAADCHLPALPHLRLPRNAKTQLNAIPRKNIPKGLVIHPTILFK